MSRLENHYGITVHSSNLRIVGISSGEDGIEVNSIEEISFAEHINLKTESIVKISAILQSALDTLSLNNKIHSISVSFTLPGYLFLTANLPFDNTLLQHDLAREFKWEFSLLYPFVNESELVLRFYETKKNNFLQSNIAIVTAIERKYIRLLDELCNRNNFKFRYVDHSHFASDRILGFCRPDSVQGFTLSLFFENNFYTASVNLDGLPVWFGGFRYENNNFNPDEIFSALKNKAPFRLKKELIDKCFIAGNKITDHLIQRISEYLQKEPQTFNPFVMIKPGKVTASRENFQQKNFLFTSAAGIAFRIS